MWSQYYGAHQRYFKYLCIASKISHTAEIAKNALLSDNSVVIGLVSTGEASINKQQINFDSPKLNYVSTAT